MEGHELLAKMTKVRAPADFEAGVLARLPAARAERTRARQAHLRYAFAGTAALLLVGFLIFSPGRVPEREDAVLSQAEQQALSAGPGKGGAYPAADRSRALPVYERMNYASELRNAQSQPGTVYILEQVSEVPSSEIIY
jgi:hypothetical protein